MVRRIEVTGDERELAFCAYCGFAEPATRDHVPPKVLLDRPYPEHAPFVGACRKCNAGFSLDEEYLACLLECTITGSTDPVAVSREQVRRTLTARPALRARLEQARTAVDGSTSFAVEWDRVKRIAVRLAQGHALYEMHTPQPEPPTHVVVLPLLLMREDERLAFETVAVPDLLPEVGSRALARIFEGDSGWVIVQPGRYRYLAWSDDGARVRIVLSEYLACEVAWE